MVKPSLVWLILARGALAAAAPGPPAAAQIPSSPVSFGVFTARFTTDGAFTLEGDRWPSFKPEDPTVATVRGAAGFAWTAVD